MATSNLKFSQKSVIVTGGGSGIGRATALAFAREGARVCVADWHEKDAQETVRLAQEFGAENAFAIKVDVSVESDVKKMVQATVQKWGRLDIAFNNAGISGDQKPLADGSLENWNRVVGVNLTGVWLCMKYQIPEMLKNGSGAIVNNASILGAVAFAGAAPYTATKHGVIGLTQCAAVEYSAKGIRVNAVCPGFIETPMLEQAGIMGDKQVAAAITGMHAMNRMGKSEEIASTVLWLSSSDASFVTGQPIFVDGGYTSR